MKCQDQKEIYPIQQEYLLYIKYNKQKYMQKEYTSLLNARNYWKKLRVRLLMIRPQASQHEMSLQYIQT